MELSENRLPIRLKRARIAYVPQYLVSILLILGLILALYDVFALQIASYLFGAAGFILFIATEIIVRTHSLEIEKNKITQKWGILSRHSDAIYYEDMTDILIHKSLIGRIFNYGKLHINTGGSEHYEIDFKSLKDPEGVRNFLEVLEKKHVASRAGVIAKR